MKVSEHQTRLEYYGPCIKEGEVLVSEYDPSRRVTVVKLLGEGVVLIETADGKRTSPSLKTLTSGYYVDGIPRWRDVIKKNKKTAQLSFIEVEVQELRAEMERLSERVLLLEKRK